MHAARSWHRDPIARCKARTGLTQETPNPGTGVRGRMRDMAAIPAAPAGYPQHRSLDFRRPDGQPLRVLGVGDGSALTDSPQRACAVIGRPPRTRSVMIA